MEVPTIQELASLPLKQASERKIRAENYQGLRHLAIATAILAFLALLYYLLQGDYRHLILPIVTLVMAQVILTGHDRPWFQERLDWIVPLSIPVLLALIYIMTPMRDAGLRVVGIVGVMLLASAFRFSPRTNVLLFATVFIGSLAPVVYQSLEAGTPLPQWRMIVQSLATVAGLYFAIGGSRRMALKFARQHRIESSRTRERLRMREELDSARQIQLSMLPSHDPDLDRMDIASVSLPATEVGGDYFEYFVRDDGRLELAVGDVAGHGLSSGLMLSGLRSCLHLLQIEELTPEQTLARLHDMVCKTTSQRLFITLLLVQISADGSHLRIATAGHPPLLRCRDGEITELGAHAMPLGTGLGGSFRDVETDVQPGDLLVAYTDGLTETANSRDELYGEDRLFACLRRAGSDKSARRVREAVLSDVWTFKGDAEQNDDLTLIVMRAV